MTRRGVNIKDMIVGYCLLLLVGSAISLSPADVTYVEGRAPDDLKAGPDSKSALFGSGSIQTKGFSANFNQGGGETSSTTSRTSGESTVSDHFNLQFLDFYISDLLILSDCFFFYHSLPHKQEVRSMPRLSTLHQAPHPHEMKK